MGVKAHGGELAATVTQAPMAGIRLAGNNLIHATTRSTILKQNKGTMTSWVASERGGLIGKRLTYELVVDGQPMRGIMEVYVSAPHIITMEAKLPVDAPTDAEERFFRSLVAAK